MKYPQTMSARSRTQPESSTSTSTNSRADDEKCSCLGCCWWLQLFWPRVVVRKWLNINNKDSDYSADTDSGSGSDNDSDSDTAPETTGCGQRGGQSRFGPTKVKDSSQDYPCDAFPGIRRRKSETFRAQYISQKDIRICVGTWNVGGRLPSDDLEIDDWIDTVEPADVYVLGLQEIVPLNAGNIFGAEDSRPVQKWENIIRETLNRIQPPKPKIKCHSDPPSPSKFKPFDDMPDIGEDTLLEIDSDIDEEIHPLDEETDNISEDNRVAMDDVPMNHGVLDGNDGGTMGVPVERNLEKQFSSQKKLDRLSCFRHDDSTEDAEPLVFKGELSRMLSGSERIGLSWPEPPLNLISQHLVQRPNSFKSIKSFKSSKSFGSYASLKKVTNGMPSGVALFGELDFEALMKRKRRPSYVRIVSKQMVGIFLTVWVRRSLRKHIQNLKVSTVGVGVMGYIGNKGSISVSMSIYQTLFCFICTHLTSGEKDADQLKRNADVQEIHRRTQFHPHSSIGLPKTIHDHERIIWLGDLNYRINLSYEKTRELISRKQWSKLMESDQLVRELRKGRAFDGWCEGTLNFPPTYKYEMNSDKYYGEDPKAGRRVPAWCDRILSYGKGMRLLNYRRTELKFSDHRPVTATFMAEVEVFSPRKLQRALTFTDAEIENSVVADMAVILE